jgi:hypothetical protein
VQISVNSFVPESVRKFIIRLVYDYYRLKETCPLDWPEVLSLLLTLLGTFLMILEFLEILEL